MRRNKLAAQQRQRNKPKRIPTAERLAKRRAQRKNCPSAVRRRQLREIAFANRVTPEAEQERATEQEQIAEVIYEQTPQEDSTPASS